MDETRANLIQQISERSAVVPPELSAALSPATLCVREWRDHPLDIPGAQLLRVGHEKVEPVRGSWFNLRFENRLGLARIQPLAGDRPMCPPLTVEVISPKFPTPAEHFAFFSSLLEDVFARGVRLPFHFEGPTERGVQEALQPPTPLFVLHFLTRHAEELRNGLAAVKANPHRCLADEIELVPLSQASDVDADILQSILRSTEHWIKTDLDREWVHRLNGHAPTRVRQRLPAETLDTPENRFVRYFVRQLLVAAETLVSQTWWTKVDAVRRARTGALTDLLRRTYHHPMFDGVGPMKYLPVNSQVLLRREGYRTLLDLWRRFHRARRPLFAHLQQGLDVRDIATLYEIWVFFALIDQIQLTLDVEPGLEVETTTLHGLRWKARARFGATGTLTYNQGYRHPNSYSVALRPDFSWSRQGQLQVVLDAKFRLDRLPTQDEEDSAKAAAERTDLYKMHTYRDALGARAAVAVYPGTDERFYHSDAAATGPIAWPDLLTGTVSGIGAIPMKPFKSEED
jgi:predicted component of viral defense system (DUF524 family)